MLSKVLNVPTRTWVLFVVAFAAVDLLVACVAVSSGWHHVGGPLHTALVPLVGEYGTAVVASCAFAALGLAPRLPYPYSYLPAFVLVLVAPLWLLSLTNTATQLVGLVS